MVIGILGMAPFSTVADYALTTIPMFILMAFFSASSGLARDLYTAGANWLSHIKGGLAVATVFACGIFGAMSGASVAAASVMSSIAMPEMRRHGYSEELAAGSIGIGATLDILIPPSVAMVIYGVATQTSIGKLLIAGVVPGHHCGHLPGFSYSCLGKSQSFPCPGDLSRIRCRTLGECKTDLAKPCVDLHGFNSSLHRYCHPNRSRCDWRLFVSSDRRCLWPSPMGWCNRSPKGNHPYFAMIFMIIIGATIFGSYMALSRVPQQVVAVVAEMNLNRWVVIVGIVVAYFVVSMFMDEIPLLLLTLQLTFPLITNLGFDPIWFGVLSMMMVSMGLVFPPVGMIAFVVSATANVSLVKVYKGTSILMIAIVLTTILIMIFPQIVLWLPATMR